VPAPIAPEAGARPPRIIRVHLARAATIGACLLYLAVGAAPAAASESPFAVSAFTTQATEATPSGGSEPVAFDQAGGHPFALTTTVKFAPGDDPKDLRIELPPGLLADPRAVAQCPPQAARCPTDSQVGVFSLHFTGGEDQLEVEGSIYNLTPYTGVPAELGLEVPILDRIILTAHLIRSPAGYTLALVGSGLPTLDLGEVLSGAPPLHLSGMETTLWGVPAAATHDAQRGISCFGGIVAGLGCQGGGLSDGEPAVPFITMPSGCSTTPVSTVWADSWQEPGRYVQAQSVLPTMSSCDRSAFWPELSLRPETLRPEAADGVSLAIKVHEFEGTTVAAPELRAATITLPQGMAINPAVADGLQACPATGAEGVNIPTGVNSSGEPLAPGELGPGEEIPPQGLGPQEPELSPGHCPNASIVGTAEAITPLLAHPIEGRVYIATPGCGGDGEPACTEQDAADGNLYKLWIELGAGPNTTRNEGVLLKLAASVEANPATGQLTVHLTESPQLPLSELTLHLFGGERALLVNPSSCGAATTTSDLQSWSAPFAADASPSSYFNVTGCTSRPLAPRFLAGVLNPDAAASSPFILTLSRGGGEPYLSALQAQTPPGVSAMLSSVPLCTEPQASSGGCPDASRVGSAEVSAGGGSLPLRLPGAIYLTTGFGGAPFGLSIVTNADAGPLHLGAIVTRAAVTIDPATAALTITTNPLPQIVLGVPLRVQRVSLNIDRPGFILNPTDCDAEHVTATIASTEGASTNVSDPFAVGDCASLPFKPKLTASTTAHNTFASGASLDMRLTFPPAKSEAPANLKRIRVALPIHLPSRLTTLQGACPEATFASNPAACPPSSTVGIATAHTPLLSGALTGPVVFVTHGRDQVPAPSVILQGDGVTLILQGSTAINTHGVATVAFNSIPDVPLQSLELYLPQGAHSLVTANTDLCALTRTVLVTRRLKVREHGRTVRRSERVRKRLPATLRMPTELAGQNGAVIHGTTPVTVSGCPSNKRAASSRRLQASRAQTRR
jgi:hypothetical protein